MSRKIKFRAWNTNGKRMIYLAENMKYSTHLQLNNYSWGIFEPDREGYCGGATCNKYNSDILMQYTGLKDKYGKEIYDGDIVMYQKENGIIKWENDRYIVSWINKDCLYREELSFWCTERPAEVIGNIYENKELLESEVLE